MKILTTIARVVLGLGFTVFGANIIHPFLPMPNIPMPDLATKFVQALSGSHYFQVVGAFQLVGGLLILSGYFVPIGLTLLGPVLVNILLFHTLLAHGGFFMPLVFTALYLIVFAGYRSAFAGVFKMDNFANGEQMRVK